MDNHDDWSHLPTQLTITTAARVRFKNMEGNQKNTNWHRGNKREEKGDVKATKEAEAHERAMLCSVRRHRE
jgi:hypothetical protein